MPRNSVALPAQLWPGMRIHIIDMLHPPGMGMSCIADINSPAIEPFEIEPFEIGPFEIGPSDIWPHQAIVNAALAANNTAPMPTKVRREASIELMRREFMPMPHTWIREGVITTPLPLAGEGMR